MDFELTLNGITYRFEQFQDLTQMITMLLAQWNNFEPDGPMVFMVKKVESETETLGVTVEESLKADDIFGRP